MKILDSRFIVKRCSEDKQDYSLQLDKVIDDHSEETFWYYGHARKLNKVRKESQGYGLANVKGRFVIHPSYQGCPSCGNKSWVHCGSCGRVSCNAGQVSQNCSWCNKWLGDIKAIQSLETAEDI